MEELKKAHEFPEFNIAVRFSLAINIVRAGLHILTLAGEWGVGNFSHCFSLHLLEDMFSHYVPRVYWYF